jgi:hypothetical protein
MTRPFPSATATCTRAYAGSHGFLALVARAAHADLRTALRVS